MKIKPLYNRIVVSKPKSAEEVKTKSEESGLIFPTQSDRCQVATVMAVGEGVPQEDGSLRKLVVRVGDSVLFEKDIAVKTTLSGEEFHILNEDDILAILS